MTLLIGGGHLAHVAPDSLMELGTTVIFYGLYFGVLGRDIAEVCTELIAVKIGVIKIDYSTYKYIISIGSMSVLPGCQ